MITVQKAATRGMAILAVAATAACSSAGGLGNILGGVLGQGQGQGQGQVSGTVQQINTRNQQLTIQQRNGQNLSVFYDNQTQVVYQNQNYSVNNLEYGDRITARISNSSNNQYYTDLIQVDQSVTSNTGGGMGGSSNVQTFEGTARNIDRANGTFQLSGGNYGTLLVTLPYNPRQTDINRFQSMRSGDYVRIYGILVSNNRVELRQFN